MKYLGMLALLSLTVLGVRAQESCGTDLAHERLVQENPQIAERMDAMEEQLQAYITSGQASRQDGHYIIPTVVHVMWSDCEANISKAQVQSGIDMLNNTIRLTTPDTDQVRELFRDHMGGLDIEFRLARIDPDGNPTDGINRVNTSAAISANENIKNFANWDSNNRKYFQIWLAQNVYVGTNSVNGYAWFPGTVAWSNWGVLMRHDKFGGTGTSTTNGSTLPHEVGHNLNLFHTFQDGCGSGCSTTGDRCCDTPPAAYPHWDCNLSLNTCSNDAGSGSPYSFGTEDMHENIMAYGDCRYIYTNDQIDRIVGALESHSHIRDLHDEDNLLATGVTGFQEANFTTSPNIVVADRPTIFEDATIYDSDAWQWDFGASSFPPSSTQQNPEVTIIETGLVPVDFKVFYQGDSMQVQRDVFVVSERGYPVPMSASFESTDALPSPRWMARDEDEDGVTWQITEDASYVGDKSIMIESVELCGGAKDELVSSTYDLEPFNDATLEFKVAYALKTPQDQAWLRIWMSEDYGENWDLVWVRDEGDLVSTNDYQSAPWAPQDSTEWNTLSVNFANSFLEEGAMFKFEFEREGGNNFYIDDARITGQYRNKVFLNSPENGTQGLAKNVVLDWKAVGGVDFYEYQIDGDPNFNTSLLIAGNKDYISASPENDDTEFLAEELELDKTYYWRVRASVGGVYTEWSDIWNFRISPNGVGLREMADVVDLKVYPNPANELVTIEASEGMQSIRLIDLRGRVIAQQPVSTSAKKASIGLSGVQAGAYLIEVISSDGHRAVERLIIQ